MKSNGAVEVVTDLAAERIASNALVQRSAAREGDLLIPEDPTA